MTIFLRITNPLECKRYAGVRFIFSFFFISHTAWVIVFKHGNTPSKLGKEVSLVGLRKTTYTPVHASSSGLGSFYQLMIAEGKPGSLQRTSATAIAGFPFSYLGV
jgi:hypothetical protein